MQGIIAGDRRLQSVQFLLKTQGLIGLIKPCVEQCEASIAQRKDADRE